MKIVLEPQEVKVLRKVLEWTVSDMGTLIRHTRGLEAKEELKHRRRMLRRVLGKLMIPSDATLAALGLDSATGRPPATSDPKPTP
jgi:hypothetical protein